MRFDKNIWDISCGEYSRRNDASALDVSHFTSSSKVFVSLWLELLQDYRAPITRQLHELSTVDLTDELLRALDLWTRISTTVYRVINFLERLKASVEQLGRPHPAEFEADRYLAACDLLCEFLRASKKERESKDAAAVWPRACAALGFPMELNGANPKAEEVFALHMRSVVVALRAALDGREAFVEWLLNKLQRLLLDAEVSPHDAQIEMNKLVRELLGHALTRGFSREHLAELPIKYLRADNTRLAGKGLADRVNLMFGTFRGAKQRYKAFVPLTGSEIEIDGAIFPDGITLEPWGTWRENVPDSDRDQFKDCQAFYLDIDRLLEQDFVSEAFRPHDVFSARDIALKSVRRCLDVVFLLKGVVPNLETRMLVSAWDAGADEDAAPYMRLLELRRYFTPESIHLKYLRSVPAEWVDALHWFREGVEDPSDEVGIVNLWTSLELLSRRSKRQFDSDADRVRATVGELASISILADEFHYFAFSARTASSGTTKHWTAWIDEVEADILNEFSASPHLAGVFVSCSAETIAKSRLGEIRALVRSTLLWAYGCRNDIVHEGRRQLPGADVLRDSLAAIARAALTLTLRLESQGFVSSLEDAFFWAEQELTTLEAIGASKNLNALVERVRIR